MQGRKVRTHRGKGVAVLAGGGEVIGVIPQHLMDRELAHYQLVDLQVVPDMRVRKARMAEQFHPTDDRRGSTLMPIVIDASVAMAWCFDDEATDETEAVLDQLRQDEAAVPAVWQLEVANVVLISERRRRTTTQPQRL